MTFKGAVARESLGSENVAAVPKWAAREGFANDKQALAGANLFAQVGCQQCHTYLGTGAANLGAPELTAIAKGRPAAYFQKYVANPRKFGNNVMPIYGEQFTDKQLSQIAAFLAASKGPK